MVAQIQVKEDIFPKTKKVIQYRLDGLLRELKENQFLLEPVWDNYAEIKKCSQMRDHIEYEMERIHFFLYQYEQNIGDILKTLETVLEDVNYLQDPDPSQKDKE